jgi:hypothetical protein
VKELSGYVFSPLREGDIALYRGSGNGLASILLAAAEETSLGCVERLEHEYALRAELDVDWAARPVALTRYNDRMTLVLEDPGGAPVDRLLGRPLDVSHFLRIAIPLAGALRRRRRRGPAAPRRAWILRFRPPTRREGTLATTPAGDASRFQMAADAIPEGATPQPRLYARPAVPAKGSVLPN